MPRLCAFHVITPFLLGPLCVCIDLMPVPLNLPYARALHSARTRGEAFVIQCTVCVFREHCSLCAFVYASHITQQIGMLSIDGAYAIYHNVAGRDTIKKREHRTGPVMFATVYRCSCEWNRLSFARDRYYSVYSV